MITFPYDKSQNGFICYFNKSDARLHFNRGTPNFHGKIIVEFEHNGTNILLQDQAPAAAKSYSYSDKGDNNKCIHCANIIDDIEKHIPYFTTGNYKTSEFIDSDGKLMYCIKTDEPSHYIPRNRKVITSNQKIIKSIEKLTDVKLTFSFPISTFEINHRYLNIKTFDVIDINLIKEDLDKNKYIVFSTLPDLIPQIEQIVSGITTNWMEIPKY
jgi:hypothetical protein